MRKKSKLTEVENEKIANLRKQKEDIDKLIKLYKKLTGKNLLKEIKR
jgi:hypothetical protein